jgi:hypothetical protein
MYQPPGTHEGPNGGNGIPPPPLLAPGDYHHPVPKGIPSRRFFFPFIFFILFFVFRKYFNSTKNQICIKFTKKL